MSNSKVLFQELVKRIHVPENEDEIQSIVYMILEHQLGIKRSDVMMAKEFGSYNKGSLDLIIQRVNAQEPIQYILGDADFFGRKFLVNPSVLIPRQETELLIYRALKLSLPDQPKILDIGTGSGCIAITLALEIPKSKVVAIDISQSALTTALQNSNSLNAHVEFLTHDILTEDLPIDRFDLIVSNPPYISKEEKAGMQKNVLDYEPHLALFSEGDPLLFYRKIAQQAKRSLRQNGQVVVEINEHFGKETLSILQVAGFLKCELIKDMQNKDRIIVAQ
ncbi:MAG TPA: peptide chain release factor N(5)-glutamine methyltransferase [Cyclobacteriaceae bacterium]|jgi:release factor glutamine methyltransferase|nr:peptide chain release factor N(5)-glutamine methyltransferase [Cyclobacteriaceae bacterium]